MKNDISITATCPHSHIPVPQTNILFWASKLIPQAHANNIFCVVKHSRHCTEAFQPFIRVEVHISKEAIAISSAAAPPWSGHLVVKYDHNTFAG